MYSDKISAKHKREKKRAKAKKQLNKLISHKSSDSEEESEHELSYYLNDRVKMMKEVLKIIKPKKLISMAPDIMKKMDMGEIKAMLLEELLGISNKRLKYIFEGKNLDEETSSSEEDEDNKPVDIISLDDVSDGELVIEIDSDDNKTSKKSKKNKSAIKSEPKSKKVKKERPDKTKKSSDKDKEKMGEENLMSVLELLELQARARAIRSQLALEAERKEQEERNKNKPKEPEDVDDGIISIEIPKNEEIVITDSENEKETEKEQSPENVATENDVPRDTNENTSENVVTVEVTDNSCQNNVIDNENISEHVVTVEADSCQNNVNVTDIPLPTNETQDISTVDSDSDDDLRTVMLKEKRKKELLDKMNDNTKENVKTTEQELSNTDATMTENDTTKSRETNKESSETSAKISEQIDDIMSSQLSENDTSNLNETSQESSESNVKTSENVLSQCDIMKLVLLNDTSKPSDVDSQNKKDEPEKNDDTEILQKDKKVSRLRNLKNRLKSYKNEFSETNTSTSSSSGRVNIIENVVLSKPNKDVQDEEEIIINIGDEDIECIICD